MGRIERNTTADEGTLSSTIGGSCMMLWEGTIIGMRSSLQGHSELLAPCLLGKWTQTCPFGLYCRICPLSRDTMLQSDQRPLASIRGGRNFVNFPRPCSRALPVV